MKGPEFLKFCIPIIEVLRELGYSGTPAEVTDQVIERLKISEEEQAEVLKNGQSRVRNKIAWARFYLAKAGIIDSSSIGMWRLTDTWKTKELKEFDVYQMFQHVHAQFKQEKSNKIPRTQELQGEEKDIDSVEGYNYREELLELIKGLSPSGFERLCQRFLRAAGFTQVIITGGPSDEGIDGVGVLQINPLIGFKVLFQCKRYRDTVGPSKIRDFRGALQGRADKGLIITTGTFTTEAKKESQREGAPPIDLVDGEMLIDMFEKLELGLQPKKMFEIDKQFFTAFEK